VGSTAGLEIGNYVAGNNISAQTTVTSTAACGTGAVQVSGPPLTCPSPPCAQENITFYGPDVVDVLDVRVTIDGFTGLSNGGNDLVCINTKAHGYGLQVKNAEIADAMNDDIHAESGCPNVRFIGNIVSGAGKGHGSGSSNTSGTGIPQVCGPGSPTCSGRGVRYSGVEMTIADGVVEESQGYGLDLDGTQKISVSAMHFQGNGLGGNGGAAIRIRNSFVVSICGNHMEGNGGDVANSAHIRFDGTLDNINICSNVYEPQSLADVPLRPLYVYDAAPGTVLTNMHIYDAPAPQASGQVYSPNALALLPQLQIPHVAQNAISGLTLSNSTLPPGPTVNIAPGEASDSTNSVNIQLASTCPVNLAAATNGAGGLDTGSVAADTTYFYFLIATASGGNPNCIASISPAPTFANTGTTYTLATTANTRFGSSFLYNMGSVAGLAPGQLVQGNSYVPADTTITTVGTLTTQATGSVASDDVTVTVPSTANIGPGMAVSDVFNFSGCSGAASSVIPAKDTVAYVINPTVFTLAVPASGPISSGCIVVSSGNTVQLSNSTTGGYANGASFSIYNGVYAMVAPLYTNAASDVVGFTQDSNTFYLTKSVPDIVTGLPSVCAPAVGASAISCPLSVPCGRAAATCAAPGFQVEAFGRIVGGSGDILLSSLAQEVQLPNGFGANPPGYSTNSATTSTSHPFRLDTDGNGNVRVQGSAGSSTVYEDTDGWVVHR
jgi:hypothetical protein